jgi:acyl carrier protein
MSNDQSTADVQTLLRAQLQEILYCDPSEIADDAQFAAMGLDSVLGVELLAEVNRRYGLSEKVKVLYAYPTVNDLTAYLVARVSGDVPQHEVAR